MRADIHSALRTQGLFADCAALSSCVSSQDDRPSVFAEPWMYDGAWEDVKQKLLTYIESAYNAKTIADSGRYIRAEIAEPRSALVDDCEWFFTPNDNTVQLKCQRRDLVADFGENRRRAERIRIALHLENVIVLRDRKRAFLLFESPFDTFGPSTINDFSPEEMDNSQIARDPDSAIIDKALQKATALFGP